MKRVLILTAFILSGCASTPPTTVNIDQPPSVKPDSASTMMAGVSSVDITPPPGLPMAGYSMMANKGKGFRTRLKARTLYLDDGKGRSMALVQMDMFAGSLLLQHKVASAVAEKTGLNPGDIAVIGTHTHSAPSNYHHNDFYNKHASSGIGFEERYLEFMTARIVEGVEQAWAERKPAKIATGRKDIYGYNRNRSLSSYVLNPGQEYASDVFKAVNPSLYMIRVDGLDSDGTYKPMGAFSSFSVHATTLSALVDVYNADLFGYAQRELEWAVEKDYDTSWPVIHALATGTHGDMAPALADHNDRLFGHAPVNWKASKELGQGIGREAIGLFKELEGKLSTDLALRTATREINIMEENSAGNAEICSQPFAGNALAGGAYERRTPWLAAVPVLQGGNALSRRTFSTDGCQGNKRILGFSALQPLFEPTKSFPTTVLFQLMQVNDMAIVPLPFEITADSGRRMRDAIFDAYKNAGNTSLDNIAVISTSNGYFGYTTTPEEYDRQNYEGGHTLYGRYTTPYLVNRLGQLAEDSLKTEELEELLPRWTYTLKTGAFMPEKVLPQGSRAALTDPAFNEADESHEEDYIAFRWSDAAPFAIKLHEPLVSIETKTSAGWQPLVVEDIPVNDQGYDIEVRLVDTEGDGMAEWETRWYNPLPMDKGDYRFVIEPRNGSGAIYSKVF
ncbi:neutral/alkaline non-lysosomal ceramidase N-terminal domain-containing protein [Parendozoicomonas haliclonae]|nr:neutral/alkaline non-lysosomal ceramidase N-terminal domain-containing protein [Parendozoicomonas haliclonae]